MTVAIDMVCIFNLQSNISPGKSHQRVAFAFYFKYLMQLSQQYTLYHVTEILTRKNL